MPKRRQRRMRGRGLSQIQTADRNLKIQNRLLSAKKPLQQPGQLYRPLGQSGGSAYVASNGGITDKYGQYLYMPKT